MRKKEEDYFNHRIICIYRFLAWNKIYWWHHAIVLKTFKLYFYMPIFMFLSSSLANGFWSASLLTNHWHTVLSKAGIFPWILIGIYWNRSTSEKNAKHIWLNRQCFHTIYSLVNIARYSSKPFFLVFLFEPSWFMYHSMVK